MVLFVCHPALGRQAGQVTNRDDLGRTDPDQRPLPSPQRRNRAHRPQLRRPAVVGRAASESTQGRSSRMTRAGSAVASSSDLTRCRETVIPTMTALTGTIKAGLAPAAESGSQLAMMFAVRPRPEPRDARDPDLTVHRFTVNPFLTVKRCNFPVVVFLTGRRPARCAPAERRI